MTIMRNSVLPSDNERGVVPGKHETYFFGVQKSGSETGHPRRKQASRTTKRSLEKTDALGGNGAATGNEAAVKQEAIGGAKREGQGAGGGAGLRGSES